jgi:hypothetical protein
MKCYFVATVTGTRTRANLCLNASQQYKVRFKEALISTDKLVADGKERRLINFFVYNTSICSTVIGNCQWVKRCLGGDDASSVEAFLLCMIPVD